MTRKFRGVPSATLLEVLTAKTEERAQSIEPPRRVYQMKPVHDESTGAVVLYDIYYDGKWCGSRRSKAQCVQIISGYIGMNGDPDRT